MVVLRRTFVVKESGREFEFFNLKSSLKHITLCAGTRVMIQLKVMEIRKVFKDQKFCNVQRNWILDFVLTFMKYLCYILHITLNIHLCLYTSCRFSIMWMHKNRKLEEVCLQCIRGIIIFKKFVKLGWEKNLFIKFSISWMCNETKAFTVTTIQLHHIHYTYKLKF